MRFAYAYTRFRLSPTDSATSDMDLFVIVSCLRISEWRSKIIGSREYTAVFLYFEVILERYAVTCLLLQLLPVSLCTTRCDRSVYRCPEPLYLVDMAVEVYSVVDV